VSDGVVATRHGAVRGTDEDGLWCFRGIPYARPPVGLLRWRPPLAPEPWTGVRNATEFGPISPQPPPVPGTGVPGDPQDWDEDSLSLNVWTPGLDGRRRPVMVFIHGGGFVTGSGAAQLYRGDSLARRGDTVVVTLNYRLGVFGFLAHPALADATSAGHGNWGLLDDIAALEWVGDHIAGFGGDPSNVTIFGESAGSISVCALIGSSRARGLFRRAIAESGPAVAAPMRAAARIAASVAGELGLHDVDRETLCRVPVEELLGAQARVGAHFEAGMGLAFQPVVDGGVLVRHPADSIATGGSSGIDLLIGTNRDEFKFFAIAIPQVASLTSETMVGHVETALSVAGLAGRAVPLDLIATYASARESRGAATGPVDLFSAMASDWLFRIPSVRLAEAHAAHTPSTYSYLFEWESPFGGGILGACHALELPFVFGTYDNEAVAFFSGNDEDVARLSGRMQDAWLAFARTGRPAVEGLDWPAYEPGRRATMVFDRATRVVDAPYDEERAYWQGALGRYGLGGPFEGGSHRIAVIDAGERDIDDEDGIDDVVDGIDDVRVLEGT
jgi:para-nitrobenzyl esterase